jgi:23S rRNA (guanosine2251-2'-O)-methyltransferase
MKKLKLEALNRISTDDYKKMDKVPVVVVLEDIRSALNVGSVFRTSDAFSISTVLLCGITAQPPNKEILKTALGSCESVDWLYYENIEEAIKELKQNDFKCIGIEQTDNSVFLSDFDIKTNEKYALIIGNEVDGVTDTTLRKCDDIIEVPQWGTKHSINVAVCAGIVLWEFAKKYKS